MDSGKAKDRQFHLDAAASKKKLLEKFFKIFLARPLTHEEFSEISELLCLDAITENVEEGEDYQCIIESLLTILIDLFEVSPREMRALIRMIDKHLEKLV